MAAYEYLAFDAKGSREKGIIEADTAKQARQQLRGMGLSPVEVEQVSSEQETSRGRKRRDKINVATLSLLTRQLSTLISAGQPIESALYAVSQQTNKPQAKKVLLAVRSRVLEGHALSDAFREFPRIFDAMYCASVHAGEQSGLLDLVMERLADFMESRQSLQQKTRLALIYPILLTVVSLLLVTGLLTFVVPQIIQVFEGFDQELPILTQGLIALSDFFKEYGLQLIVGILLLVISYGQLMQISWVSTQRDRIMLRLPLFNVRDGGSIAGSLAQTGYFSPLVLQLISNGEASGKLGEMLERSAKAEESEFQGLTALFLGIFEPAMILLMGVVVLIIVLAILLPIFDMNDLIQ